MSYTSKALRPYAILAVTLITGLVVALATAQDAKPADKQEPDKKAAKGLAVTEIKRDKPIDFQSEILPLFKQSCLSCHNKTKAKAKLNLESPQSIAKGGESGKVVIPGKALKSLLFINASHRDDPIMPPKGNKSKAPNLTADQLGLLKLWIDQGAEGQIAAGGLPVTWQPLPKGLNPIMSVAVSSDGQFIACGRANQIFVYHLPSKSLVTRLTDPKLIEAGLYKNQGVAHHDLVQSLAFSPDGNVLASGGYRTVKLWQRPRHIQKFKLQAGESKAPAKNQPLILHALAVSPDGKWLATGATDNTIILANAQSGKVEKKLTGHSGLVSALCFSADSQKLYSGSADKTVRAWTIGDGKPFASAKTSRAVNAITWIGGPGHLATGANDNIVRLWKLPEKAGDAITEVKQITGHTMAVTSLATASKDGKQILSGSLDGTARLWNVDNGQIIRQFAHGAPVTAVAVRPDAKHIATGAMNSTAILWNATNGQKVKDLTGNRYANERVADISALEKFTSAQVSTWNQSFTKAQEAQKKAAAALIKATDEKAPKLKAYTEKGKPHTDALAAKITTEREVGQANLRVAATTEVKQRADQAVAAATEFTKVAAKEAATTKTAYDKVNADFTAKTKASNAAKTKRDQTKTDFDNKTKASVAAKTASDKAKTDYDAKQKLAVTAIATAKTTKTDYDAKQKLAVTAVATAKTTKTDYDAKQKLANDTKAASDKAAKDAQAAQKAAEEAAKGDDAKAKEEKTKQAAEAKVKADKLAAETKTKADEAAKAKTASDNAAADGKTKTDAANAAKTASDKAAADGKTKTDGANAAKTASDKAAADGKAKTDAANAAKTVSDKAAADGKTKTDASNAAKTASATALTGSQTKQKATVTAKTVMDKAATDYASKQKAADAAKKTAEQSKAAYDVKQKQVEVVKAGQQASEQARNTADQQLKAAQATQKQTNDKLKVTTKKITDTKKEYDKVKGEYDGSVNKFHQASLALRNSVRNLLEIRDNLARVKRQQTLARDKLSDAHKTVATSIRPIRSLGFSTDNLLLAIAGDAKSIHIYSAETGTAYETLEGHEKPITALAFTAGGQVVSRDSDVSAIAWQLNAPWKIQRALGSGDEQSPIVHRVLALSFSPDGEYIAIGGGEPSRSGQISIWRATDGRFVREFIEPHSDTVFDLEFSPDSRFIASASADRFAKIFYASDGKLYKSFEGHTHHVLGVSWNKNGQVITTVGADKGVKVWNAITGERKKDFSSFKKEVTSVKYVGYTNQFLLSSGDAQVRISKEDGRNVRGFSGASKFIYGADLTPDGKIIAAGGEDSILRVWNGTNGKVIATFAPPVPQEAKPQEAKKSASVK